ncbi:MAG: Oxidoreductase, short-chain dehydrogenase/reductase family, partial [uncultured Solirubrobacteraceae bacterium]
DGRDRIHRTSSRRAPARARRRHPRAGPRGVDGEARRAHRAVGTRGEGPDQARRRRPRRAEPRRRPERAQGQGRPLLPPRGDLRHDRGRRGQRAPQRHRDQERRRPGQRRRGGDPPPHLVDRRRRQLQGPVPRGPLRRGPGAPERLPPHEVRVREDRTQRVDRSVARVPPRDRRRSLRDRRDGQDRRPVLLLQAHPEAARLAARVVPARRPGARLDQRGPGRLRRQGDGPHRASARPRRPGVPPRQPAAPALGRGAQHLQRGGPRPADAAARRQADHRGAAQGRPRPGDAGAAGQERPPDAARRLRDPRGGHRPRRPAPGLRHPRHRACAQGLGHRRPRARGLRLPAVGLLGAQPRPGPLQGPLVRGRGQRQARRHHRRVVGHRRGRRDEDRGRRWHPAARRPRRRGARGAQEEDRGRRRHGVRLLGRPLGLRVDRCARRDDPRRASRRRHPRQQRGPLDPPLDRAEPRSLPRLRADDAAELLRRDPAHDGAAPAHARAQVRPHHPDLVDRRADEPAALQRVRGVEGGARRVDARGRVGDDRRQRPLHDDPHAAREDADDRADEDLRRVPDAHARRGRRPHLRGDPRQAEDDQHPHRHVRRGALRARAEGDGPDPPHRVQGVPRQCRRVRKEGPGREGLDGADRDGEPDEGRALV